MAFDPKKPLTFQLPDADGTECNVMTYEFFTAMMEEFLTPILTAERANGELLDEIEHRIDEWLEEQQPNT